MSKHQLISKAVDDFYNQSSEEDRLTFGLGPLEFERNKELIERFLSGSNLKIADIGGGTGKYSEWLAQMGHEVWMIDPIEKHIKLAQKRSNKLKNKFHAAIGEARNLEIPDEMVDMVILHGPLYHLQDREDRIQVIAEASRITKPGGIILGFAINYTASTLVGLLQGVVHEDGIFDMCLGELTTGQHNAPENMPGVLAEAFYHRPEELQTEFLECGLNKIEMFAVEGIIWLEKNYFSIRGNRDKYNKLLEINKIVENDKNLIAFSPHIMAAGYKNIAD